jgi:hypothetical protein
MGRDGVRSGEFNVTVDLQISHQDAGQEHGSDWADVCWRCILARWVLLARGRWEEGKDSKAGALSGRAEQGSRGAGFEALRAQSALASAHLRTCRRRDLQAWSARTRSPPAASAKHPMTVRKEPDLPVLPGLPCHRVCLLVCCPSPTHSRRSLELATAAGGSLQAGPPIKGI